ncbi:unnamed protein product, partial [Symbiodinium sp. CCMP2456]
VYTPVNSATARRKDRLAEIEKSLTSMASLQAQQEEQLAKTAAQLAPQTRKLFQMLLEDEEAEATEELVVEASAPPTTTTTATTTTTISLKEAASKGDVAALAAHRQAGSDLDANLGVASTEKGWTAAHYAASYGHAAALKFLHEAGANLNATTDYDGATPAMVAAQHCKEDALKALAEAGADLQKPNIHGRTPAHLVAFDRYRPCLGALRVLIQAGVDLNAKDPDGETPADRADGWNDEALKLILEDEEAEATEAAERGDVAALEQHLQAGADLNATLEPATSEGPGWTAVKFAARDGHVAALKFLQKAGVNVCAAAKIAALNHHAAEMLEVLAKAGCDLNAKVELSSYYDPLGGTAAHWAARNQNHTDGAAALKFLHEAGANLDAKADDGSTPACWAADAGSAEALEVLAEAEADLNAASNKFGMTPAHVAAATCHLEALRTLIKAGVNLNVIDNDGQTAADRAVDIEKGYYPEDLKAKREEALKLILQAGGKRNKA